MPTKRSSKSNETSKKENPDKEKEVLSVNRFHMNHILPNNLLLIMGCPEMTDRLILDYLDFNLDLPIGLVISDNLEPYKGKVPDIFLFPGKDLDETLLSNLESRQKTASKRAIDNIEQDPRAFCIITLKENAFSQLSSNTWTRLKQLINERHRLNLTVILAVNIEREQRQEQGVDGIGAVLLKYDPNYVFFLTKHLHSDTKLEKCAQTIENIIQKGEIAVVNYGKNCESCRFEVYWYHINRERIKHFRICHPKYWEKSTRLKS